MFAICLMCGIGILVNCAIALFTEKEIIKDVACITSSIFAALIIIVGMRLWVLQVDTLTPILQELKPTDIHTIKEDDKLTDIFITFKGKEYHFTFDITEGD